MDELPMENTLKNTFEYGSGIYYEYLYNFALHKINDSELAKDLVQDTFLTAVEAFNKFEKRSSELTWLTAILKHKIFRVYRRNGRQVKKGNDNDLIDYLATDVLAEKSSGPATQLDKIVDREFMDAVTLFLQTLPPKWQEIYQMRYLSNVETTVICKKLNLSAQNYWVISHRLKAALRKWYLKTWLTDQ